MHKRLRHKTATFEHTKPVTSDPHKVEHNSHNKRITHTVTTTTVATNNPPKMCTVVTTTRSHSDPIPQQVTGISKFNTARTDTRDQSRLEKPHPQSQLVWPLPHKLNYCLHLANNSHLWFTMGLTSPQHLMVTEHTKLTSWTFTSR